MPSWHRVLTFTSARSRPQTTEYAHIPAWQGAAKGALDLWRGMKLLQPCKKVIEEGEVLPAGLASGLRHWPRYASLDFTCRLLQRDLNTLRRLESPSFEAEGFLGRRRDTCHCP